MPRAKTAAAPAAPAAVLPIDIRHPTLGRLSIRSGTTDPKLRDAYHASVETALDTAHGAEIIRRLKLTKRQPGKLTPQDVHDAVRALDIASLVAGDAEGAAPSAVRPAMLGATVNTFLEAIHSDAAAKTAYAYTYTCRQLEEEMGVRRVEGPEELHRRAILADVAIRDITREQGQTWLKGAKGGRMGGRPWGPQRQSVAHAVAHQLWALARAQEEDEATRTGAEWRPWRNFWAADRVRKGTTVRPAKKQKTRKAFLTRKQAADLLRATKGTHLAAWVAIGFYAGLRITEVCHLRVGKDVDLERAVLHIQARKGEYAWKPKNGDRDVEMNDAVRRWVRRHVAEGFASPRYLFHPAGKDKPLSEPGATRWAEGAFRRAGIRYGGRSGDALSFHSLRHTFASWLAMAGWSPSMVAELMGDTVKVVLETYIHLWPKDRRKAVDSLRKQARA